MKKDSGCTGFTLVEILIVVSIIGLLAVVAMPSFLRARTTATGVRVANDLRVFGHAFVQYSIEVGVYPGDTHEALPSGMEPYIDPDEFNQTTAIGGRYNWEGPDQYPYVGVSVSGSAISQAELLQIDGVVDDGNLSSGVYRRMGNGRYTYVIE